MIYFIFIFKNVHEYVSVDGYVHVSTVAQGAEGMGSLGAGVIGHMTWVLGPELGASASIVSALNH